MQLSNYIFEAIVSLFVAGFAWGFRSWASAIRESTEVIIRRLETMTREIHGHRIESVEAFARLDERVRALESHYFGTNGSRKIPGVDRK